MQVSNECELSSVIGRLGAAGLLGKAEVSESCSPGR